MSFTVFWMILIYPSMTECILENSVGIEAGKLLVQLKPGLS